ncbi:transient receptor potential cation channel subfamily M member 2-like [Lissotriton helveticus]
MGSMDQNKVYPDAADGHVQLREISHLHLPLVKSRPVTALKRKVPLNLYLSADDPKIRILNSWFAKNINKKECVHFIKNPSLSDDRKEVCYCGNAKSQHLLVPRIHIEGEPEDTEWIPEKNIEEMPTDSFGDFTFKGLGNKITKYVRASNNTSSKVLYEMMTDQWQLSVPNLLITVTGGAKNFSMNPRLKNLFSKGLIKAAQSTGAWIITGGCHAGVMKLVGEAVRDFGMSGSSYGDSEIVTIGIATWGIVYNRASLISKAGGLPAEYYLDVDNQGSLCCLDNNHSHFILVDDGTQGAYGVEIPLRTKLEKFISEQTVEKGGAAIKIPIVCVVLEGGPGSLDTIHSSMMNNTPCVIVEGSGRVADVIAQVADMNPSKITIALIKEKLRSLFQDTFDSFSENKIIEWTKKIQDIVRMSQLLTVFRENKDGAQDVDVAILQALLKASQSLDHEGNENWDYQLKLAVSWNRLDIAKSDIFNSERNWKPEDLYPVLTVALIENKPNFVQLFLDHGVSLRDYVTWENLTFLYNNMESSTPFFQKLEKILEEGKTFSLQKKNQDGVKLHHVARALKSLLGEFTEPLYSKMISQGPQKNLSEVQIIFQSTRQHTPVKPQPDPEYPIRDLLIWAILQNRGELAEILWTECRDCIVGALACCKIMRELAKEEEDTDNLEAMLALAQQFEERAAGVFSECSRKNEARAEQLLTRVSSSWGNTTCLQLALNAEAMSFMSNGGVQMFLTKIWWGKLAIDNALIPLIFCIVFFPLIYTGLVSFRRETAKDDATVIYQAVEVKRPDSAAHMGGNKRPPTSKPKLKWKESRKLNCWQRLTGFFTAPVVVFYANVVSYIGFLWLFAYVLTIDFQTTPSWREYLLYVWIFSLFCEEVRELFYDNEGMTFVAKGRMYISEFWNMVDVVAIILFAAGLTCRCITVSLYAGRVILAVDFIVFCLRLMCIFTVSKVLGPKIIMMQRMIKDIFFFLFLLSVWVVSFGVSKQAIMIQNEERLDWIFRSVIYQPYLTLFGQLPTDVDKLNFNNSTCTADGSVASQPKCAQSLNGVPIFPEWLTIVLLCLYLLFANILLLNLLIAMFSYTFSEVQDHTDQIWKFQRHDLIEEYSNRPAAPPPFILFSLLYFLVNNVMMRRPVRAKKLLMHRLDENETATLLSWEEYMKENYVLNQRDEQNQSSDMKIRDTSDKVDTVVTLLEFEQEKQSRMMEQRLVQLEEQVFQSTVALSWIMKSLMEKGFASKEKAPVMVNLRSIEAEDPTSGNKSENSKSEYHVNSRQLMYPGSNVNRFPVPDELVPWEVDFPGYNPPFHIAEREGRGTYDPWAETSGSEPKREYNSKTKLINLESACGKYTVKDGLPLNPMGRTGLRGVGSLRWNGPNHCLHPVLTRWKKNTNGSISRKDMKKVLEVLVVKRVGAERWGLPGGTLGPGEKLPSKLKEILKKGFWKALEALLEKGTEVYIGYLDDPRNTDNAWVETRAVNVHFESPEQLDLLTSNLLDVGPTVSIRWQIVDQKIPLFANMKDILQSVAESFDAHY